MRVVKKTKIRVLPWYILRNHRHPKNWKEVKKLNDLDQKLRLERAERYACQSVARKALTQTNERVHTCLRGLVNNSNVQVWKHRETHKAFYGGLMVCGSVWQCPVCAAKISEKRRHELKTAFDIHKHNGGHIAMLTLTFSHTRFDKLTDLLQKFGQATQKFMSGKAFNNIRNEMQLIGRIRVMEITYSDNNGFHPHAHIALFYQNEVNLNEIQFKMYDLWDKACSKVGLKTSFQYGLSLDNAEEAEKYLSKHGTWSLEQELSKAHIKKAKYESMTPFDFLRRYLVEEDEKYLKLFKEYALCFKGKRQLQWSQGLKKMFILEEKTDEELAKEKTEEADLLGLLEYDFWKKILKYEERTKLLDMVEKYGFEQAIKMIEQSINNFENKKAQTAGNSLSL